MNKTIVYDNKAYEYLFTCYIVTDSKNNFNKPIIRNITSLESTIKDINFYLIHNDMILCDNLYETLKNIKKKNFKFYCEFDSDGESYVKEYNYRFKVGEKNGKHYLLEIIINEQYERVENELQEAVILAKN